MKHEISQIGRNIKINLPSYLLCPIRRRRINTRFIYNFTIVLNYFSLLTQPLPNNKMNQNFLPLRQLNLKSMIRFILPTTLGHDIESLVRRAYAERESRASVRSVSCHKFLRIFGGPERRKMRRQRRRPIRSRLLSGR